MCFFNLIQKHHRIRLSTHLFSELSTLFIAHIAWRCSHQSGYGELLHVFRHVDSNQRIFLVKEIGCKRFGKLCLSNSSRSEENKGANWLLWVFQTYTGTLNGFGQFLNCIFLSNHSSLELFTHVEQFIALFLSNSLGRNASHHRNHFSHMVFIHGKPLGLALIFPLHLRFIQLLQEFLFLVAKLCSFLILLRFDYTVFLGLDVFYFRLQAQDILRNINVHDVYTSSRFIQYVNGLVRKEAIRNVTI